MTPIKALKAEKPKECGTMEGKELVGGFLRQQLTRTDEIWGRPMTLELATTRPQSRKQMQDEAEDGHVPACSYRRTALQLHSIASLLLQPRMQKGLRRDTVRPSAVEMPH